MTVINLQEPPDPSIISQIIIFGTAGDGVDVRRFAAERSLLVSDAAHARVTQEFFCFHYSFISLLLHSAVQQSIDWNPYGKTILDEARRKLLYEGISCVEWAEEDREFFEIFDSNFRFYYHNQVPAEEVDALAKAASFSTEEVNARRNPSPGDRPAYGLYGGLRANEAGEICPTDESSSLGSRYLYRGVSLDMQDA